MHAEEFSKIREEIPLPVVTAHMKAIEEAHKEGITVDANFGLDKTGIAGTLEREEIETKEGLFLRFLQYRKLNKLRSY